MTENIFREPSLSLTLAYHSFLQSNIGVNREDSLSVTQRSYILARILIESTNAGEFITAQNSDGTPLYFYALNNGVIHWEKGFTSLSDAVKNSPEKSSIKLNELEVESFILSQLSHTSNFDNTRESQHKNAECAAKAHDLLYQLIHSQTRDYLLNAAELLFIHVEELGLISDCFKIEGLRQSIIDGITLATITTSNCWDNKFELKLRDKNSNETLNFEYIAKNESNTAQLKAHAGGSVTKSSEITIHNFLRKMLEEFENINFVLNTHASDAHKIFNTDLLYKNLNDLLSNGIIPPARKVVESGLFKKLPPEYPHDKLAPEYLVSFWYDCLKEYLRSDSEKFSQIHQLFNISNIKEAKSCPATAAQQLFNRDIDLIKIVNNFKELSGFDSFLPRYKTWVQRIEESALYESFNSLAIQASLDALMIDTDEINNNFEIGHDNIMAL
ncbi:hypothetical protein OCF84_21035 (plasmid) [Shewanella xiamenensis]|uniref:Uncharacterized protein n=1 Tax=Shewanella xiamenensis TaxID=332186 RepID=A0ABT6UDU2_9GAMM|nr:hypothetical protein [Shewanella xiamenensis]MDI5832637.1 hypothetical protein [Shewanella xiamenensis]WHF58005.1 hypothetical protein OCF84_21035 [Shewanella xiamenensis]